MSTSCKWGHTPHNHSITVNTRTLALMRHLPLFLRPHSDFAHCANNDFCRKGSSSESLHLAVLSSLLQPAMVPSLFSTCATLTLLKITGQLFCRMSFNLSLPSVFSWLDPGYGSGIMKAYSVLLTVSDQVASDFSLFYYWWWSFWSLDLGGVCCALPL